jgi:hypothetical protein
MHAHCHASPGSLRAPSLSLPPQNEKTARDFAKDDAIRELFETVAHVPPTVDELAAAAMAAVERVLVAEEAEPAGVCAPGARRSSYAAPV